jgi:hypothetical protein
MAEAEAKAKQKQRSKLRSTRATAYEALPNRAAVYEALVVPSLLGRMCGYLVARSTPSTATPASQRKSSAVAA